MMVSLTGRFEWMWLVLWGSAYVYYLVLKLPRGVPRLLALLPLLPFYILVPWRAPTHVERSLLSFFFLWMGAFKLIMLAYEYGPAKDPWMMSSFPRFLTGISFSMHMNADLLPTSESQKQTLYSASREVASKKTSDTAGNGLLSRKRANRGKELCMEEKRKEILSKIERRSKGGIATWMQHITYSTNWRIVLLRCLLYFVFMGFWLQQYMTQTQISAVVLCLSYTVVLYVGVLFAFELPAAVAASFLRVQPPAQFNMPFLATSIADFWGRRWNLLVNNLLRVSVYYPILAAYGGRSGKRPSAKVRAFAVVAAFTVSGVMHEVIFFYMSRRPPTFEVTMFFVLNGIATVLESQLRKKYNPPKLVGWAVTFCFVFFTAAWLFFPPLIRDGSDRQSIEDLNRFILWVRDLVFMA